jgi:hypothetical protein
MHIFTALLALFKLPQGPQSAEMAAALFQALPAVVTDGNRRKCGVIGLCQGINTIFIYL